MAASRSPFFAAWRCLQDAHCRQHFFLRQRVAVVRVHRDAVVVTAVFAVVQGVAEEAAVGVVLQVADGFAFACDEADAVFPAVEVEDLVQRRAVPAFWLGNEDELVRTFAAFEGVRAADRDEVVVAVRAGEGVRGFAGVKGEGVTAAFAEAVKDFCAALVCQFGVIGGVEGRAAAPPAAIPFRLSVPLPAPTAATTHALRG